METITTQERKTLVAYQDKSLNRFGLIEKDLPILTDEIHTPFLLTRDHMFTTSTLEIVHFINNYKALRRFNTTRQKFANILIIPGLLISLTFILKSFGLFKDIEIIDQLITNKVTSMTFWLSIIGATILWYDYYRTRSHPIKLPYAPEITDKELEFIKGNGFKFARYGQLRSLHFLSEQSQYYIVRNIKNNTLETIDMFKSMLSDELVEKTFRRANIELLAAKFEEYEINSRTMPEYPVTAVRSLITYALEEAIFTDANEIKPIHLVLAYIKVFPVLQKHLKSKNTDISMLREAAKYLIDQSERPSKNNTLNHNHPYYQTGGIGKAWITGKTYVLDHFSRDLTHEIIDSIDIFGIGHEAQLETLISTMSKVNKRNALLIGEAGVGKSSLVKALAQRINKGEIPLQLHNKRIVQLNLNNLITAASQKNANIESLIKQAMDELEEAGNIILYIDEIQETIPSKAQESAHTVATILLPYIVEGKVPVIGTINYTDYKKYFYTNDSLRDSFETIEIPQLTPEDTIKILESKIPYIEHTYNSYVTIPALTSSIALAQRYINQKKLPDSAVNTLEATASWAQAHNITVLTEEHVAKAVSLHINIPIETITTEEITKLMQLEQSIKKKVIGQDPAVHSIVEALKLRRTEARDPKKPIGVFLFVGPEGTGKTYLAQILSDEYFGNKEDLLKIDMSDYQDAKSISKLLGKNVTSGNLHSAQSLIDGVKSNPYRVILIDNLEKAHPQVLDLLLELFNEGRLISPDGESIDFANTIIINTSSVGSKTLSESLTLDKSLWEEAKDRVMLELRQAIRPELLNRFDDIIIFSPQTPEDLKHISELLLLEFSKSLSTKGIALQWSSLIPAIIAERAGEPGMGARPLKSYIQDKIETSVYKEITTKKIQPGSVVEIKPTWLD